MVAKIDFYTAREAGQILGIHQSTVNRLINQRKIHAVNVGAASIPRWRIPHKSLELFAELETDPAPEAKAINKKKQEELDALNLLVSKLKDN